MLAAHSFARLVLIGVTVSVLSACATQSVLQQSGTELIAGAVIPANKKESVTSDGRMTIEGYGEVSVHSTYTSASGRQCRRLVTTQGQLLSINSCRRTGGDWYFTRSLTPVSASALSSRAQTIVPVVTTHTTPAHASTSTSAPEYFPASANSPASTSSLESTSAPANASIKGKDLDERSAKSLDEPLPVETVAIRLDSGETLWAFASRVTGNAMNWEKIARHNGIDDARSVTPNQYIEVQTSLVKADL